MILTPPPVLDTTFTTLWIDYLKKGYPILNSTTDAGPTANRPTVDLFIGRQYYDTSLSKPVYLNSVNPNVWKDAAGTTV